VPLTVPGSVLREADKLGVTGYPVGSNIILLEPFLHENPSGLIKVNAPSLHDAHDLFLPCVIQALARITLFHISTKVEG